MGYESIIEAGVALASAQFDSMKMDVVHKAWIGEDGDGEDQFASPVVRKALVDLTKGLRATKGGRMVMTHAVLTFLDPVPNTTPNTGKVREQPIDPRDVITLPDGSTSPIQSGGGFGDSLTSQPFVNEVILGVLVRGE